MHMAGKQQCWVGYVDEQFKFAADAVDGARRRPWPAVDSRPKRVVGRGSAAAKAAAAHRVNLLKLNGGPDEGKRLGARIRSQAAAEAAADVDSKVGAPQLWRHADALPRTFVTAQ